jgi:hypothetical protein
MTVNSGQPTPEQLKGSARRQFGHLLDTELSQEELEFLNQNGDVIFKVFHVLVNGMKDLCPSCIELMGLMTEKEDLDDDEVRRYLTDCECGQASDVLGIAEAPL